MHGGSSPGSLPILKGSFEELCAFGTDHREGDRPPGVSVKQERCLSRPAAVLRAGSKPHSGKGQDPTWRRRGLYPGFRSAPSPPPPPAEGRAVASSSKTQPAGGRGYQEPLLAVWVSEGGVSCPFHHIWSLLLLFSSCLQAAHNPKLPSQSLWPVSDRPTSSSYFRVTTALHVGPSPR